MSFFPLFIALYKKCENSLSVFCYSEKYRAFLIHLWRHFSPFSKPCFLISLTSFSTITSPFVEKSSPSLTKSFSLYLLLETQPFHHLSFTLHHLTSTLRSSYLYHKIILCHCNPLPYLHHHLTSSAPPSCLRHKPPSTILHSSFCNLNSTIKSSYL